MCCVWVLYESLYLFCIFVEMPSSKYIYIYTYKEPAITMILNEEILDTIMHHKNCESTQVWLL